MGREHQLVEALGAPVGDDAHAGGIALISPHRRVQAFVGQAGDDLVNIVAARRR